MKKINIILFVLFLICGMAGLSFAQTAQAAVAKKVKVKTEVVTGKITAIDMANNTIVVNEGKAGTEKTITVDPKVISSLSANEEVKVSVKEGSNTAVSLKKIVRKTTSTKK
ncbi:MAG: hypothetical protein NTX89_02330 [Candidatus Omnitrophica bacterium]|nr:hypothetical protein [Candidatus Omnitrophota bacterium]